MKIKTKNPIKKQNGAALPVVALGVAARAAPLLATRAAPMAARAAPTITRSVGPNISKSFGQNISKSVGQNISKSVGKTVKQQPKSSKNNLSSQFQKFTNQQQKKSIFNNMSNKDSTKNALTNDVQQKKSIFGNMFNKDANKTTLTDGTQAKKSIFGNLFNKDPNKTASTVGAPQATNTSFDNVLNKDPISQANMGSIVSSTGTVADTSKNEDTSIKIVGMISSVLKVIISLIRYILYGICVLILLFSILNIFSFLKILILDYIRSTNKDMLIKDKLKYSLLQYADIFYMNDNDNEKNEYKETLFYIFNIYILYQLIVFVYIILFAIFFIAILFVFAITLFGSIGLGWKFDSFTDRFGGQIFVEIILKKDLFYAGILALILYFIYKYIFKDIILKRIRKVKDKIYEIDSFIDTELVAYSPNIDSDVYDILKNRTKNNANGESQRMNEIITNNLNNNNIELAKQNLVYYTLYSHVHNNIPDTNVDGIKLVNKYFFGDDKQNKYSDEDDGEITYISLMVNTLGFKFVDMQIYQELDIFKGDNQNIKDLLRLMDNKIEEFNEDILLSLSEIPNLTLYFALLFVLLIYLTGGFMLGYSSLLRNVSPTNEYDKPLIESLKNVSYFITYFIITFIKPLDKVYAFIPKDNK